MKHSFQRARRERGRRAGARGPRLRRAVPHPVSRPARRARRPRHPREVADRLGQDTRFRDPDRRARSTATARRPEALVLVPTRELALQVAEEIGSFASAKGLQVGARLRRRAGRLAGEAAQGRAHRRRDAGPAPGSDRAPARLARRHPHPRPRRGRPDARHGLPPAGRADPPQRPAASGRRCSSPRRSTARSASSRTAYTEDPVALRGAARDRERRTASSSTTSCR